MIDFIKATGTLNIVLRDLYGNVKEDRTVNNLVVTVGKNFIASRMVGVASTVMTHMAIGTSVAVAAAGNTQLGTENTRTALTSATATNNEITFVCTFVPAGASAAITEAGIFNNATPGAGIMLSRTVFNVVNKETTDSLTITWKIAIN